MKPNKAAGPDEILLEFIKSGGLTLKHKIFKLIMKIWKQEKNTLRMVGRILCPIFKKGQKTMQ